MNHRMNNEVRRKCSPQGLVAIRRRLGEKLRDVHRADLDFGETCRRATKLHPRRVASAWSAILCEGPRDLERGHGLLEQIQEQGALGPSAGQHQNAWRACGQHRKSGHLGREPLDEVFEVVARIKIRNDENRADAIEHRGYSLRQGGLIDGSLRSTPDKLVVKRGTPHDWTESTAECCASWARSATGTTRT